MQTGRINAVRTPDGTTTIMMDKWFASALREAFSQGAGALEGRYEYTPDTVETLSETFDQVVDLGPTDDLDPSLQEEMRSITG